MEKAVSPREALGKSGSEPQFQVGENETVQSLNEELSEAIESLEFDKAAKLRAKIEKCQERDRKASIDAVITAFNSMAIKLRKEKEEKVNAILNKYNIRELEIRKSCNEEFLKLGDRHVGRLSALDEELFQVYREIRQQPIPAYDDLISRAKNAAQNSRFDEANQLQKDADDLQLKTMDGREDKFVQSYKAKFNAVLSSQKEELSVLYSQMTGKLEDLEKEKKRDLKEISCGHSRKLNTLYKSYIDFFESKKSPKQLPEGLTSVPSIDGSSVSHIVKFITISYQKLMGKSESPEKIAKLRSIPTSPRKAQGLGQCRPLPPSAAKIRELISFH